MPEGKFEYYYDLAEGYIQLFKKRRVNKRRAKLGMAPAFYLYEYRNQIDDLRDNHKNAERMQGFELDTSQCGSLPYSRERSICEMRSATHVECCQKHLYGSKRHDVNHPREQVKCWLQSH